VLEEVEETSRKGESTAHEAPFPGISEEDTDEQDSFAKLLAEMELKIEEEADIRFGDEVGSVANASEIYEESSYEADALTVERDVRTDHPTSIPVAGVADSRKTQHSEEVLPTGFSCNTQEVPSCVVEPKPEELSEGNKMPVTPSTDRQEPTRSEEREGILYSDGYVTESRSTFGLDNDEVHGYMNLEEIFSFLQNDDEKRSITSSSDNESIHTAIEELTLTKRA